jgi:hypothetical protein
VAAQPVAQSLFPRHHMSLHRCQLDQTVGYLMSSMHALRMFS